MRRRTRHLASLALLAALLGSPPALAVQPDEVLSDPKLEQRARDLSQELRCMVCQNQSIDDSEAPLARDLRILVRERLTKGDSDKQVIDYLVARYGEFVLLKPRFEGQTLLLWVAPPVLLLCGGLALFFSARRRKTTVVGGPESALSGDEERRIAALIKPGEEV